MSAVVLDFFEWKFNHRVVTIAEPQDRLEEYLEMEMLEALKSDTERNIDPIP